VPRDHSPEVQPGGEGHVSGHARAVTRKGAFNGCHRTISGEPVLSIRKQTWKVDPTAPRRSSAGTATPDCPRGPITIDPETRDIVQNEYLREVRRVDGRLANVEIETIGTAVKDVWKELQKKK